MTARPYSLGQMAAGTRTDPQRAIDTFTVWIPHAAGAAHGNGTEETARYLISRGWHIGDPDRWPSGPTADTAGLLAAAISGISEVAGTYVNAKSDLLMGGIPSALEPVRWPAAVRGPECADPHHPYGEDHYKYLHLEDGCSFYVSQGGFVRLARQMQSSAGMVTTLNNKINAAYDMHDGTRQGSAQQVSDEVRKASNITEALMRHSRTVTDRCRRLLGSPGMIAAWASGSLERCEAVHRHVHS